MFHALSHRAYVEVLLLIIEHVRLMERILQELALHLLVEHVVFHVWSHAVGKRELIVLLASIARACHYLAAVDSHRLQGCIYSI